MGLLGKKERAKIDAMFADKKTSAEEILAYIAKWVIDRVAEGTFTEAEAEKDLEIELYMGRGLLVCREYEAIVKMLRMLTSCAEEGMNHSLWCYLKGMGHTSAGELAERVIRVLRLCACFFIVEKKRRLRRFSLSLWNSFLTPMNWLPFAAI